MLMTETNNSVRGGEALMSVVAEKGRPQEINLDEGGPSPQSRRKRYQFSHP